MPLDLIEYKEAIQELKKAILHSRYNAAKLVNRELLSLYFGIGQYVSEQTRFKNWGKGAIETISDQLQTELPGIRGFSASNIKNMRLFFEEWSSIISNRQLITADLPMNPINISIRQLTTAELSEEQLSNFLSIGFTHHREIIRNTKTLQEKLFYIEACASQFWSIEKLSYQLKSNLYKQRGSMISNFETTIPDEKTRNRAILSFKDELLLDFVNIEEPDEELNERVLENAIINNIKKFIMAMGTDFSFIGNQHRLMVDEEEYFVDLLFFNRKIQSLVAIDLKKGKFKAEYIGKLNLYLSALDDYVKLPHENASIGIILCKEKNNKVVEFSIRDTSKPMGVVTYKLAHELPEKYKNILPDENILRELL
jgi:predicted nuclease of restriction endonuclease-like (RecB) superfamily